MSVLGHVRLFLKDLMTPINEKQWVFENVLGGGYADNPKYLSEKLHELDDSAEIVWLLNEKLSHDDLPDYVKAVPAGSKESEKYYFSGKIFINNSCFRGVTVLGNGFKAHLKRALLRIKYIKKYVKKGQKVYSTWHGTPLKLIERDLWEHDGNTVLDFMSDGSALILGNQFTAQKMRYATFGKVPVEVLGSPRNDLLFGAQGEGVDFREKLGLPADKKLILFAPTFRNGKKDYVDTNIYRSGIDQLNIIDFPKLFETLKNKFGGSWVMVCRFHSVAKQLVDWDALSKQYGGQIINGNAHEDMTEYLACADILLTDASSSIFDFILTERPCFLYFPDLEHYETVERGFYMPIKELPFPLAVEFDELLENIRDFDNDKYIDGINKLKEEMGYREDGHASERILEWIFKDAGWHVETPGEPKDEES